ncbi:MAG TPA: hypothetical protein VFD62_18445 [Pyrinomonadaceae bacterium]|nr:hypothetical protein [Pyrinomonadaceae bacterium]
MKHFASAGIGAIKIQLFVGAFVDSTRDSLGIFKCRVNTVGTIRRLPDRSNTIIRRSVKRHDLKRRGELTFIDPSFHPFAPGSNPIFNRSKQRMTFGVGD